MTTEPEAIPASLSIEDAPLGDYVARVHVTLPGTWQRAATYEVDLDALYTARLHLDNAIRGLEERKLIDAIAGSCAECQNTRMVHPLRHGRPTAEHCPICRPKIDKVLSQLQGGLLTKDQPTKEAQ